MFRIVFAVALFVTIVEAQVGTNVQVTYRDTLSSFTNPTHYSWNSDLDSAQTIEVIDSLSRAALQIFPFRVGEYEEWRSWLFEEHAMGSDGSTLYFGPNLVRLDITPGKYRIGIRKPRAKRLTIDSTDTIFPDTTTLLNNNRVINTEALNIEEIELFGGDNHKSPWSVKPHSNFTLVAKRYGNNRCNIEYKFIRNTGDSCHVSRMAEVLSEHKDVKGIILDLRRLPNVPEDSVYAMASLFTRKQLPGFRREFLDETTGKIVEEESTVASSPDAFRGPLVILVGSTSASQAIGQLLSRRPRTEVIEIDEPHSGYHTGSMMEFCDALSLPYGMLGFVPKVVYRMPDTNEFATQVTHGKSIWTCGCFSGCPHTKQIEENYRKPYRALHRLINKHWWRFGL